MNKAGGGILIFFGILLTGVGIEDNFLSGMLSLLAAETFIVLWIVRKSP